MRCRWRKAALLVGLLPSPNGHDPCQHPGRALQARNRVLQKMADTDRLSAEASCLARRRSVELASMACGGKELQNQAPYYTEPGATRSRKLIGSAMVDEGNFLIETHLDPVLQQVVEEQLERWLPRSSEPGVSRGAVMVLDYRSGGILAFAGGRDYRLREFNRATVALRQPGSTFKLMAYLAALKQGLAASDRLDCSPSDWEGGNRSKACADAS